MTRRLPVAAALLAATVVALPALAADAPVAGSVITDAVGDANFTNGQGLSSIAGERPDGTSTGPASLAGADLERIRFETTSTTGADGVRTPTGLKIHITTAGVPGSMAQTLIYRVGTTRQRLPQLPAGLRPRPGLGARSRRPWTSPRTRCSGASSPAVPRS